MILVHTILQRCTTCAWSEQGALESRMHHTQSSLLSHASGQATTALALAPPNLSPLIPTSAMVRLKQRFLLVQANPGPGRALAPGSVSSHEIWAALKVRQDVAHLQYYHIVRFIVSPSQDAIVTDYGNVGLGKAQMQLQGA